MHREELYKIREVIFVNRNVLLVYLKDLRDLEAARYKLNSLHKQEQRKYRHDADKLKDEISNLEKCDIQSLPQKESVNGFFLFFLFFFILSAIMMLVALFMPASNSEMKAKTLCISVGVIGTLFFGGFTYAFTPNKGYKTEVEQVKEHNRRERQRVDNNATLISNKKELIREKGIEKDNRCSYYRAEFAKVTEMLNTAYSLNILSSQYRNLQSVYYIYDYMSTSQATLEETLFHEHMENGIQRILEKLDTIIAQNEEIIFQNRIIEANTREIAGNTMNILEKNQKILESQERTEQNTLEAAQNAKIAANYAEINAFFSTATYLESQRR